MTFLFNALLRTSVRRAPMRKPWPASYGTPCRDSPERPECGADRRLPGDCLARYAARRSLSAFVTHSCATAAAALRSGIQDLPFERGRAFNRPGNLLPPLEILGRRHHDILRHANTVQRDTDFDCLLPPRSREGHHHQQVHVAVRAGRSPRVRAEKDHLVGIKTLDDPLYHPPDG